MKTNSFLLYGAYGYTGALIAKAATAVGLPPLLAGRNQEKLTPLALALDLESRAIDLRDQRALDASLREVEVVLHCAGPFAHTSAAMVAACFRTGTHYLDITGEIAVMEALAGLNEKAAEAGIMLVPGVGFDVVPSDCLAAHLKHRLPTATWLDLAFQAVGGMSHGTAMTTIENAGAGGVVRRSGQIVQVPAGWAVRQADFGRGPQSVISIPWGDVATAYYSTGIPNITSYVRVPAVVQHMLKWTRPLGGLISSSPVQSLLKKMADLKPGGPDTEARARGRSYLWGEARDDEGHRVQSRITAREAYDVTVQTAVASVKKVLEGEVTPGFQTPSTAFGADFILEIEGVVRTDLAL